jgi:tRNA splicing endonuclease
MHYVTVWLKTTCRLCNPVHLYITEVTYFFESVNLNLMERNYTLASFSWLSYTVC